MADAMQAAFMTLFRILKPSLQGSVGGYKEVMKPTRCMGSPLAFGAPRLPGVGRRATFVGGRMTDTIITDNAWMAARHARGKADDRIRVGCFSEWTPAMGGLKVKPIWIDAAVRKRCADSDAKPTTKTIAKGSPAGRASFVRDG